MTDFKYGDITEKIIGAALKVHSSLGNGFQEKIYGRALAIELKNVGLEFVREFSMPIFYNGRNNGNRRVDFFVEGKVMVELKAIIQLEKVHLAQAKNYLETYNIEVGLLINFGSISLEFKRLMNNKYKQEEELLDRRINQTALKHFPENPQIPPNPGSDSS